MISTTSANSMHMAVTPRAVRYVGVSFESFEGASEVTGDVGDVALGK